MLKKSCVVLEKDGNSKFQAASVICHASTKAVAAYDRLARSIVNNLLNIKQNAGPLESGHQFNPKNIDF